MNESHISELGNVCKLMDVVYMYMNRRVSACVCVCVCVCVRYKEGEGRVKILILKHIRSSVLVGNILGHSIECVLHIQSPGFFHFTQ